MKRFALSFAFVAGVISANAQVARNDASYPAPAVPAAENEVAPAPAVTNTATKSKVVFVKEGQFTATSMNVNGDLASFDHLPDAGSLRVYVTNASGDVVIDRKINARQNAINISKLKSGLHFVTVVNEFNDFRKSFTLAR